MMSHRSNRLSEKASKADDERNVKERNNRRESIGHVIGVESPSGNE